jgi:hypothetical protein
MNATDDNKEELYPLLSPTAPHAAIADDDFASFFLSAATNDSFLLFSLFNCCWTNALCDECVPFERSHIFPCRPMSDAPPLPPPLMTSFFFIHLLPRMTACSFIISFWTDECDQRQRGGVISSVVPPTAPHVATVDDDIASFFYPPPPMTAFCSFLFNCCRTNAECDECVPF